MREPRAYTPSNRGLDSSFIHEKNMNHDWMMFFDVFTAGETGGDKATKLEIKSNALYLF